MTAPSARAALPAPADPSGDPGRRHGPSRADPTALGQDGSERISRERLTPEPTGGGPPIAAAALARARPAADEPDTAPAPLAALPHDPTPAIALLGTSADPPTHGHRALLQGLLRQYPAVATWASDNPQKRHTAPLALRQALLAALVAAIDEPRLQLVQALSSPWTEVTLQRARQLWPQRQPVFVVGSDLVDQIPRWRHAARWLPGCRLAVVPRAGWSVAEAALERLRQLGARPELLTLDVPAAASSGVRAAADPGAVPEALWPLLRRHDPYGFFPRRCGSPWPSSTP
jgi:nicotinate-nucleotide adenylyltransferase